MGKMTGSSYLREDVKVIGGGVKLEIIGWRSLPFLWPYFLIQHVLVQHFLVLTNLS